MNRFEGVRVLLTGGIGRATAVRLAGEGGHVFGVDRDERGLAETGRLARGRYVPHTADVTGEPAVVAAVDAAVAELGGVDVLVNVASIAATQGNPYMTAYAASKGAVLAFSLSLAAEVVGRGIRVVPISPGYGGDLADPRHRVSRGRGHALLRPDPLPARQRRPRADRGRDRLTTMRLVAEVILAFVAVLSVLAAFGLGSVVLAARSVPVCGPGLVRRRPLAWGSVLSVSGIAIMAIAAWSTHEDGHYDDFGSVMSMFAAMAGGASLLLGLGPFSTLLLGLAARCSVRLPGLVRLAVRDLADRRVRTAPAVTTTMLATALAVTVVVVASATTAQSRADYEPEARPGALLVRYFSERDAATVLAAIRRELPGIPVVQSYRDRDIRPYSLLADNVDLPERHGIVTGGVIGDGSLLRYLTGDPSTPYDENTAVLVTADHVTVGAMTIDHSDVPGEGGTVLPDKRIPATVARPADPLMAEVFVPEKVMRNLGHHLRPDELIVDPSVHRTSAAEQQRIDRRLGEIAQTYVERGYQAPAAWRIFVTMAVAIGLGGALAAVGGAAAARPRRVLLRAGGGSAAPLRVFAAWHAGFGAAVGTAMGAVAGCVIGLLLAWPMTASSDWEPEPRVGFATPWPLIAALVAGLPALAAAVAAATTRMAVHPAGPSA